MSQFRTKYLDESPYGFEHAQYATIPLPHSTAHLWPIRRDEPRSVFVLRQTCADVAYSLQETLFGFVAEELNEMRDGGYGKDGLCEVCGQSRR